MANVKLGFCATVGNTPLIKIKSLSELTGCTILGKAEFLNPGGSVKDRAALGIIEDAEKKGLLKPGATIVEGTAGNTGIGLTQVANAKGYKCIIVIPNTQAQEKVDYLRAIGAEVRSVPAAPYRDAGNYNHVAKRLADEIGAFWANQFDNTANRDMHTRTTGPEIWQQTDGKIDAFVAAVGTGGTLAGTAIFLKEKNKAIRIACPDPHGAAMWSWIKNGNLDFAEGSSITEGIGQNRITKNIEGAPIDDAFRIGDQPVIEMLNFMNRREGLFLGSSSAMNLLGAFLMAKQLGPGKTIVTMLCDSGARYMSKIYNAEWLKEKKLTPVASDLKFLDVLA